MAKSLIVAATGTGSTDQESFRRNVNENARRMESSGMSAMADYSQGPARVQLLRKDPRGWQEFSEQLASHSNTGSAMTFRGIQGKRPPIFDLEDRLKSLNVPTLIMTGDEDDPCIEPSIFLKRNIPASGLVVFPQSGHPINLEEPALFNQVVSDFLTAVEAGKWARRDMGFQKGSLV